MKRSFIRLSFIRLAAIPLAVAVLLTSMVMAGGGLARAQQQSEGQIPASGEATTQEAKSFSGNIVKENGELVLKDPVTKVIYKLDDPAKAKQYIGKHVKVTGKLEMNSNTIRVESIEVVM
ncbi:MAG: DUF5818 domain-containing protein [Candidatus Sulfotelmatobacter sp.]